jgi:septal ring factor EnvC (AmiA/AmiB activator)
MVSTLINRTLTNEQRTAISAEKAQKEAIITELVAQRKAIEKDVSLKRKALAERKKDLQLIQRQKQKKLPPRFGRYRKYIEGLKYICISLSWR